MGPLDKYILQEDALTATSSGFDLKIYSNWYRSLPLSSLGNLQVRINGQNMLNENVKIGLEKETYDIKLLPSLYKTWWFVLDPLMIHVKEDELRFIKGNEYKVEVEIGLLIPYVLTGTEEKPLLASAVVSKNLTCN